MASRRPEFNRHLKLVRRYGITQSEWYRLFEAQKFKCAICEKTQPGGKGWHTDHNHKTKRVRGILCTHCNLSIGRYEGDRALYKKFDQYLEKHSDG
jgi:DNA-directed RNA polymerase subunit RPC12/RpoP